MLKKLIDTKKITKKQLIQKLMSVSDNQDNPSAADGVSGENENILDAESEEGSQKNRVPREASHRNKINSNTNSNFYKFSG